jgi:hypothetical protein
MLEPALAGVSRWAAAGLSAYDATYVAVAEEAGVPPPRITERRPGADSSFLRPRIQSGMTGH